MEPRFAASKCVVVFFFVPYVFFCRYNKDIESWNAYRENTHRFFIFNRKTVPLLVLFAGVVPAVLYRFVVKEQRMVDARNKESHDYV
jgi:hypothetical protein